MSFFFRMFFVSIIEFFWNFFDSNEINMGLFVNDIEFYKCINYLI